MPGVVMVAGDPANHQNFLKAYIGAGEVDSPAGRLTARTENGDIEVLEPSAARDLVGLPVKASGEGLTLNAMRFTVADLAQTEAVFRQHEVACQRCGGRLIVPPEEAFGATLIFEAAKVG